MLPFEPQALEALRARLPAALSCVYDTQAVERGDIVRPGALRKHVFDCIDGMRCIVSLDRQWSGNVYLHMSFSTTQPESSLPSFLQRMEQLVVDFWPDTILLAIQQFMTAHAVHVIYEPPSEWKRFYAVCAPSDAPQKTDSSAG
jgi:hypothetical protein